MRTRWQAAELYANRRPNLSSLVHAKLLSDSTLPSPCHVSGGEPCQAREQTHKLSGSWSLGQHLPRSSHLEHVLALNLCHRDHLALR